MRKTEHGGTMVFVLLAVTVLLFAGLGAASISSASLLRAKSDEKNSTAFNASQAALEMGIANAFVALKANSGAFQASTSDVHTTLNAIAPGCTATYEILPQADSSKAFITGTVTYQGTTKSVRVQLVAKDYGIWNNAIFAGVGAGGQSINGNVDIRGSVHCLGDGEPYTDTNGDGVWTAAEAFVDKNNNGVYDAGEVFTDTNGDGQWTAAEPYNDINKNGVYDEPLTSTDLSSDMSGTGLIGNNYVGIDSTIAASIPSLVAVNGVKTLNAEMRVKHGLVNLSGSATIGQTGTIDSGLSKGTMDGMYVNDGYGGTQGAASVYSDNGTSNAYDLSALDMHLPILSGLGASTYVDKSNTTWTNQETYMEAKCLDATSMSELNSGTDSFRIPASGTDANGNSISWNKTTGVLDIQGIVKVKDGFTLGAKDTIHFTGNGTFWDQGSLEIDGDVLPAAGYVFPTTARIGFVVKDTLRLAAGHGASQLKLCGAYYAQNRISSQYQNQIAGTFVSSYFDMGTNVPNIYQVPALKNNLPPAMPGDQSMIYLRTKSWRQRQ